MVKVGCIVSGVVTSLTPTAVIVNLKDGHMKGTIFNEHLADHKGASSILTMFYGSSFYSEVVVYHQDSNFSVQSSGHVTLLRSLLKPGYEFDQLLVLGIFFLSFIISLVNSISSNNTF